MTKEDRILVLGYEQNRIIDFLRDQGKDVVTASEKLSLEDIREVDPSHIVSYGYRHIITPEIIEAYPEIVNMHIAYLPWNRGVNPCFWSWLENTPKGYTIHHIDDGVDTGPILVQQRAGPVWASDTTIGEAYSRLKQGLEKLFVDNWEGISNGGICPRPQTHAGTFHQHKDLDKYRFLLDEMVEKGGALVKDIEKYGKEKGLWVAGGQE